jgi:hypothetical protein
MPDESTEILHDQIRRSLLNGDFESAASFGEQLGTTVIHHASAVDDRECALFVRENLVLLEEQLSLARIVRAHLAGQLQTNTAVFLYQTGADSESCWRLEA